MRPLIIAIILLQIAPAPAPPIAVDKPNSPAAAKPNPAAAADDPDIVVSAKRDGPPRRFPAAPEYLRRFCYEPGRLTARFAPPADDDPDWLPLDSALRARFAAADPAIPAFRLDDTGRDHVILLRFETQTAPPGVIEQRCIFAIIGKIDDQELRRGLSRLFGSPGTQRHVDYTDGGVPSVPGWDQWLWTGYAARGSHAWPGHSPRDSFTVVTDPRFYDQTDYLYADLKIRKDRRVAMMSFGFKTRKLPEPKPPARPRSSR